MNARPQFLLSALASALLLCASAASAQATSAAKGLTEAQVVTKLKEAGYTKVHGVEREGEHFDADAMKDGKAVHVHVDATSGAIMPAPDESEENEKHEHDK